MKYLKTILSVSLVSLASSSFAGVSGPMLGGGMGVGIQSMTYNDNYKLYGSPSLHVFTGYQFADFIGVEAGYTYIGQVASSISGVSNVSSTIYDIAFTPGIPIPLSPFTIYGRLGVDAVSVNYGTNWANQMFNTASTNFELGAGVKMTIPFSRAIVRLEYVNYGASGTNGYNSLSVTPSVVALNAAYIF